MSRVLAALILVPLLAVAAPVTKTKAPTYYYPTREGDTLVYETRFGDAVGKHTMVVKKVENADGRLVVTIARELAADRTIESTVEVSAAGVYRRVADRDPTPVLKLPAKVGASWSPALNALVGAQAKTSISYTVGALDEQVEVPAGKFKCIRLDGTLNVSDRTLKTTAWHAPGVGLVKSVQDNGGTERVDVLMAFKPGK